MSATLFTVLEENFNNDKEDYGYGSHYVTTLGIFSTIDAANQFVLETATNEYLSEEEEYQTWEYRAGRGWDIDVDCGTIILQDAHCYFKVWVERTTFID